MTTTDDKPASIADKIRGLLCPLPADMLYQDAVSRHLSAAADIAAAGEAALRAEVEALRAENAGLSMFQCHAGYGDEYGNARCAALDELRTINDRLAADLAVAWEALALALDDLDKWVACKDSLEAAGFTIDETVKRADTVRTALASIAKDADHG